MRAWHCSGVATSTHRANPPNLDSEHRTPSSHRRRNGRHDRLELHHGSVVSDPVPRLGQRRPRHLTALRADKRSRRRCGIFQNAAAPLRERSRKRHHYCGSVCLGGGLRELAQSLLQVRNQVLDVLDAHRQSDQVFRHSQVSSLDRSMGHLRGIVHQGFDTA